MYTHNFLSVLKMNIGLVLFVTYRAGIEALLIIRLELDSFVLDKVLNYFGTQVKVMRALR